MVVQLGSKPVATAGRIAVAVALALVAAALVQLAFAVSALADVLREEREPVGVLLKRPAPQQVHVEEPRSRVQ